MGLGKMNGHLTILKKTVSTDSEGFKTETESVVAMTRAYHERRHGTVRWANLAAFSEATDLFRFRKIPRVRISADCILDYDGERYIPVAPPEDIKSRGMYIEILAKRVMSTQNG